MNDKRRPPPAGANDNAQLLTLERAIEDGISPQQLRWVANENASKGRRREAVCDHLRHLADKLELLGYGRAA